MDPSCYLSRRWSQQVSISGLVLRKVALEILATTKAKALEGSALPLCLRWWQLCELQMPSADASFTVLFSVAPQSTVPTSLTYSAPPLMAPSEVTHMEVDTGLLVTAPH